MRVAQTLRALCAGLIIAAFATQATPQSLDPLTAEVELDDAERFVRLFEETNGAPTPAQLQEGYLDPGGKAIEIFTPWRIENAENLAARIAENPELYREAIARVAAARDRHHLWRRQ